MRFNGFVFIEYSASSRCQIYHYWRHPNEKKRMKSDFSFSKIPRCLKTNRQLPVYAGSPGAVSGILMSISSTPNYFPRHELSICDVAGPGLGDGVTQSMCCLWQSDGNSPREGFQWIGCPQTAHWADGTWYLFSGHKTSASRTLPTLSAVSNGL